MTGPCAPTPAGARADTTPRSRRRVRSCRRRSGPRTSCDAPIAPGGRPAVSRWLRAAGMTACAGTRMSSHSTSFPLDLASQYDRRSPQALLGLSLRVRTQSISTSPIIVAPETASTTSADRDRRRRRDCVRVLAAPVVDADGAAGDQIQPGGSLAGNESKLARSTISQF